MTELIVGREAELEQLRAGVERALGGRGGMFLLAGEPGIGKTRLAEEVAIAAGKSDATVLWGRCNRAEGAPPYWPWVQILRALLSDLGGTDFGRLAGSGLNDVLQVIPQLASDFPDVAPLPTSDQQAARFRTYDSVVHLVLAAAAERPILLVLDDLHWADTPSLLLLQLLTESLPGSAAMVVGTYRDRELAPDHPLREGLADFTRKGETRQLQIGGLADPEAASLIQAITKFHPSPAVVSSLQAKTAGNPFFLAELARILPEQVGEADAWSSGASTGNLPEGASAVLRQRVESLPAVCRQALEAAAVIGNELQLDLLQSVLGLDRPVLLDLLDTAVAGGVVTRRDGAYVFAHGLFHRAIYDAIPTVARANLHRLTGDALENRHRDTAVAPLVQLAYHFSEAAVIDQTARGKAFVYASDAGSRAFAELAYEEAARLFDLALRMGEGGADDVGHATLLLELANANWRAGNVGRAIEVATELSRLSARVGNRDMMARAALVPIGLMGGHDTGPVHELCAAALAEPPDDRSLQIQLQSQKALLAMESWDHDTGVSASLEAMKLAEGSQDPDAIFAAIHARQVATAHPNGLHERLVLAERVLELARSSGRESLAEWGHDWLIDAHMELGQTEQSEAEMLLAGQSAERMREPLALWRTIMAHATVVFQSGRFAEAATLSAEARDLARRGRHAAGEFQSAVQRVALSSMVGGLDEVLAELRPRWGAAPLRQRFAANAHAARALVAVGELDEARKRLNWAMAALTHQFPGPDWIHHCASAAEAAAALGEREYAARLYDELLPFADRNTVSSAGQNVSGGSVARYLGMLGAAMERWDAAEQHFKVALEMNRRMGALPFVAYTQAAYAEMLSKRGDRGDERRAAEMVEAALATAADLGMTPLKDSLTRLRDELRQAPAVKSPLSAREREVAGLVGDGLSNRVIAEHLYLSERTVETHVKNICDKLGFNSRSQVAAWVATRETPE